MVNEQLQKKIDRAIKLLQGVSKANGGGIIEVAYSGGKDSDVILQLAKESGINYRAIYKNTTIDPPGTIQHVKKMGAEIMRPQKTFAQIIQEAGFPNMFKRFCCAKLKEYKVLDKAIHGIRREESRRRADRYKEPTQCRWYGAKTEENHVEVILPILEWTEDDVREFIIDRKIELAPVYYDADGTLHLERRLGCMCCPLAYIKGRQEQFRQYPRMVKFYLRNGEIFRKTHPDAAQTKKYDSVYEWFVRDVFYNDQQKWEQSNNGLFGKPDYKVFLEKEFGLDLTI